MERREKSQAGNETDMHERLGSDFLIKIRKFHRLVGSDQTLFRIYFITPGLIFSAKSL